MGCLRRNKFFLFSSLLTFWLLFLVILFVYSPARGQSRLKLQQYNLNPPRELELLKKILAFERSWKESRADTLIIGLLYQKSYPVSAWTVEDWLNLEPSPAEDNFLGKVRLILKPLDLDSEESTETLLLAAGVKFIYLPPLELSSRPRLLPELLRNCEKLKVGTFTAVPGYAEAGAAVAFIFEGEKPQIVINLEAARAQGMNFSSQFLKLATVRKKND